MVSAFLMSQKMSPHIYISSNVFWSKPGTFSNTARKFPKYFYFHWSSSSAHYLINHNEVCWSKATWTFRYSHLELHVYWTTQRKQYPHFGIKVQVCMLWWNIFYAENLDGGEYLFAFRMLMVLFRREFSFVDTMYLWEVSYLDKNFLVISVHNGYAVS